MIGRQFRTYLADFGGSRAQHIGIHILASARPSTLRPCLKNRPSRGRRKYGLGVLLLCIKSGGLPPPQTPAFFWRAPAPQTPRLGGAGASQNKAGVGRGGGGRQPSILIFLVLLILILVLSVVPKTTCLTFRLIFYVFCSGTSFPGPRGRFRAPGRGFERVLDPRTKSKIAICIRAQRAPTTTWCEPLSGARV